MKFKNPKIAIIGLGYVGLPLLVEFSKKFKVIGYDLNNKRINSLKNNFDYNNDLDQQKLKNLKKIILTNSIKKIEFCNTFVITVPTPVNKNNKPDISLLKKACENIASILKKNDVVIFESTVYPGLSRELCINIIQKKSKLILNKDFFCGYSPERINPGDKINTLTKIKKITSGSNTETADYVDMIYKKIIRAGTFKVSSIEIAEASKIIENCQRDVNIAFINELEIIFRNMNLNVHEILNAASTKWNFLNFKPGLVGGHCVSVDPYYLSYKSKLSGYNPKIINIARKINESTGNRLAKMIYEISKKQVKTSSFNVLIMGFTFKENCGDIRNTKVIDIYKSLVSKKINVDIYDPLVNIHDVYKEYDIKLKRNISKNKYDLIFIAVAHDYFKKMGIDKINQLGRNNYKLIDYKNIFNKIL